MGTHRPRRRRRKTAEEKNTAPGIASEAREGWESELPFGEESRNIDRLTEEKSRLESEYEGLREKMEGMQSGIADLYTQIMNSRQEETEAQGGSVTADRLQRMVRQYERMLQDKEYCEMLMEDKEREINALAQELQAGRREKADLLGELKKKGEYIHALNAKLNEEISAFRAEEEERERLLKENSDIRASSLEGMKEVFDSLKEDIRLQRERLDSMESLLREATEKEKSAKISVEEALRKGAQSRESSRNRIERLYHDFNKNIEYIALLERALEYKERENAYYHKLEEENLVLKKKFARAKDTIHSLSDTVDKIMKLLKTQSESVQLYEDCSESLHILNSHDTDLGQNPAEREKKKTDLVFSAEEEDSA